MRSRFVGLSFTLKGQDFEQIKNVLTKLSDELGAKEGKVVLVHGFLPKDVVKEKGNLKTEYKFYVN